MNRKIENPFLYVEVSDRGAELMRIMRKDTGAEILWNGDPAFWSYRSPILFPNVGSTWQKKMKINGKEYQTRQHGFAREKEFTCVEEGTEKLRYRLMSDEETRKYYPFDFVLWITYELREKEVLVSGETLKAENADAATEELVTTSDLGEAIGDKEQAEELVGAVKEAVVSQDLSDPEEIEAVVDDAAKEMNIQLSDEDKQKIVSLMEKISSLDLDVDSLKEQAKDLYNKLESLDLNINQEQVKGFFDRIVSWCNNIWNSIFG